MPAPSAPSVTSTTVTTKRARHHAKPDRTGENGPHLADLRAFVALCVDLPDEVLVHITDGHLDEGGRRTVTFEAVHRVVHERSTEELEQDLQRQQDLLAEMRRQLQGAERALAARGSS